MTYAEQRSCRFGMTRCPGCPGTHPPIPADGPPNSPVLFLGERPGKEENDRGRIFVGKTGQELDRQYLPLAGLARDSVRVTNVVKCYGEEDADSARFQAIKASCVAHHLRREVLEQRPSLIVTMGGVAASLVDGLNLEMQHGIPMLDTEWWGQPIPTFPQWHPARGLHQTETMLPLRLDFIDLGRHLRGELERPVDVFAGREDYQELAGGGYNILDAIDRDTPVAIDTESGPRTGFFCLSFSSQYGSGYLYSRENKMGLRTFGKWLLEHRGPVVFHNGMYDLPVLDSVGVRVSMRRFDDTMIRAYHLAWLPQALKFLAFRLCGMRMEEYEDVVLPHSVDVMMDYILRLAGADWPKPEAQVVSSGGGGFRLYQPQGLNTKIKRLITDYDKQPSHEVFKRWEEWSIEEKLPAITRFGDMPKPSIEYVPRAKAIWYACRDADATLRVRGALIRLKRIVRGGNLC